MLDHLYCAICCAEMPFERPPCVDGHGAECPESVCTACGTVVFLGTGSVVLVVSHHPVAA